MIIPDTSVWVDFFRGKDSLLDAPHVAALSWLLHPFVYGELLLGGLPASRRVREKLASLESAPVAQSSEATTFIQWAGLAGTGVGFVDANLLLSARLASAKVITLDRNLHAQAERLGVAYAA